MPKPKSNPAPTGIAPSPALANAIADLATGPALAVTPDQVSGAIFQDISEIDATHGEMSVGKVAVVDGTSMSAASFIAAAADHFKDSAPRDVALPDGSVRHNVGSDNLSDEDRVATPAPKEGETRIDHFDLLPGELIELFPPKLKVKRLHPDAQLPRYATPGAGCFDLHAFFDEHDPEFKSVVTNRPKEFRTGLAFEVPEGFVMLIYSRSGHGFKNDVRLSNCVGVIDSDYRGEVRVKLTADTVAAHLPVRPGDRIAQAMLVPAPQWEIEEVAELSETERGEGGFGSTGTSEIVSSGLPRREDDDPFGPEGKFGWRLPSTGA